MNEDKLDKINRLIQMKKIDEAQFELSKLGPEFFKNSEYLYLRSKIFYINKLYYIALDTLLIATEFDEKDKMTTAQWKDYLEQNWGQYLKHYIDRYRKADGED